MGLYRRRRPPSIRARRTSGGALRRREHSPAVIPGGSPAPDWGPHTEVNRESDECIGVDCGAASSSVTIPMNPRDVPHPPGCRSSRRTTHIEVEIRGFVATSRARIRRIRALPGDTGISWRWVSRPPQDGPTCPAMKQWPDRDPPEHDAGQARPAAARAHGLNRRFRAEGRSCEARIPRKIGLNKIIAGSIISLNILCCTDARVLLFFFLNY